MINNFAGPCCLCGEHVPKGTGTIAKVNGRWLIKHGRDCAALQAAQDRVRTSGQPPPAAPVNLVNPSPTLTREDRAKAVETVRRRSALATGGD